MNPGTPAIHPNKGKLPAAGPSSYGPKKNNDPNAQAGIYGSNPSRESYRDLINQFPSPNTYASSKVSPRTDNLQSSLKRVTPGASMDDIELQNIAFNNPFTSARASGKRKASADTRASNMSESLMNMALRREERPEPLTEENLHRQTTQSYHNILREVNGLRPLKKPPRVVHI